jgi:2,4-dienoyl-CoA reductase-like NADH-dependent reductase (Old Yellow Enzyme family)/thioredoxin reductase
MPLHVDAGDGSVLPSVVTRQRERSVVEGYSALFQPHSIGNLQLDNRLIMSAMGTGLTDEQGNVTDRMLDYYMPRAHGGVGMIVTQVASVSKDATPLHSFAAYDDRFIPSLKKLVDGMHEGGSKVCIQLMHFGMLLLYEGSIPEGMSIKVPSITARMWGDKLYEEISASDIERYVRDFSEAARCAREAGADAVELHACHGCLVSTFLSPATNHRTDRYGGTLQNRCRFACDILQGMKKRAGKDFPISVRINVTDDVEGGITPEEAVQQATILESAGADAISVSAGIEYWSTLSIPCYAYPDGVTVPLAEKVKRAVNVPVITAGKITPELADQIVRDGRVDFVALGRPLLADPELPSKLRAGRPEDIRQCLYCSNCIRFGTGSVSCTVNPYLYRESRTPGPTESPKKVMVVGGGPAGMKVSELLANKGHHVSLFEQGSELGGQWNIACAMSGKDRYHWLTDQLSRRLKEQGVSITIGTEVTKELIAGVKPDVVVLATGSAPRELEVPCAPGSNVVQAKDVIMGQARVEDPVVVVGGRFLGIEVAIQMAEQGNHVSLVSRGRLGGKRGEGDKITFRTLQRRLVELDIPVYLNTPVLEITQTGVIVELAGEVIALPASTVIVAVGAEPETKLAQELEGLVPEIHMIGDCVEPRHAAAATFDAAKLASKI